MKQTVTTCMFHDAFRHAGRIDHFSRAAREQLLSYYEEIEEGSGKEIELDAIAICCDWTEYDSAQEGAKEYGWDAPERDEGEDEDEFVERCEEYATEWLEYRTSILKTRDSVVILNF